MEAKGNSLEFLPAKLKTKLMPFQREGILSAIKKNGRCLIADEMGLGKTLQALSVAYFYRDKWPLLIVVPASLKYPWVEEVEKWFPEINPATINMIQHGADIGAISTSEVIITSYGLLNRPSCKVVQEALMTQGFNIVILDESHYMKNRKAQTTKYLVPLLQRAQHKILLTGTPALSRPIELFPQLDALHEGMFGTFWQFARKYCDGKFIWFGGKRRWYCDGASNLEDLQHRLTQDVMIRRLKKDVLTQLPAKQRQKIPFELKDSKLKKEVDRIQQELGDELQRMHLSISDIIRPQEERTAAGNPFKLKNLMSQMYRETAKVKIGPVREYVKMLCENQGLKFLIFAYHHNMMDGIAEELHDTSIKYIRIDGQTATQDRPLLVHQFQQDAGTRVAILSIKAAGVGLTLTAAKIVVFAELDWTPGSLEQCEDRAHRIGQNETVHIHYLVAKGTLDEYVWSMLVRKTTIVTTTLNGVTQTLQMETGNQGQIDKLSKADVYIPPEKREDLSLSPFFTNSQPSGQKSLLEYFTPMSKAGKGKSTSREGKLKMALPKERNSDSESCDTVSDIVIIDESPDKKVGKRKKRPKTKDLSLIEDEGNTTDEFRSPPFKTRKLARIAVEDSFSELFSVDQESCKHDPDTKRKYNETKCDGDICSQKSLPYVVEKNGADIAPQSSSDVKCTDVYSECESKSEWSCTTCTFLNHADLPYCEMCSTAKPKTTVRLKGKHKTNIEDLEMTSSSHTKLLEVSHETHVVMDNLGIRNLKGTQETNERIEVRRGQSHEGITTSAKRFAKTHEISDSEASDTNDEETGDEDGNIEDDNSVKSCETPNDPSYAQSGTAEGSPCHICSTAESIELFSEESQSNNPNTSTDSLAIEEFTDTEDEKRRDNVNESGMEADDETTIIEDSDNESDKALNGSEAAHHTPKRQAISLNQSTPPLSEEEILHRESMAAMRLFSPGFRKASEIASRDPWVCSECNTRNDASNDDCDGCLAERPESNTKQGSWVCKECDWENAGSMLDKCEMCFVSAKREGTDKVWPPFENLASNEEYKECAIGAKEMPVKEETRIVNIDKLPVYKLFRFSCSMNTARVYLYDENGEPLNVNFLPIDVQMENYGELPEVLLHPENLKHVKRFVREWNSLTATKRRVIVRSGAIFTNPCLFYQDMRADKKPSKERYTSKSSGASVAIAKATEIGGTLRVLTRPIYDVVQGKKKKRRIESSALGFEQDSSAGEESRETVIPNDKEFLDSMKGIVQALDKNGNPLCIRCQNAYKTHLVTKETVKANPWFTRFCSKKCMEEYWMTHSRGYSRQQVFQAERGICQKCNFDCQTFFERIRITKDLTKRAKLIQESHYGALTTKVKERMATNPQMGLFWHADHIIPVAHGGGECDVDNLRTLCTVCHRAVTAEQHKNKAAAKRLEAATFHKDIKSFFQQTPK